MTYTGNKYPKLAGTKKPALIPSCKKQVPCKDCKHKKQTAALATLADEASAAYPPTDSLPLTLADFAHAYNFILATSPADEPITGRQIDTFISAYYSHIALECTAYVVRYNTDVSMQDAPDQAEVEDAAVAMIDLFLKAAGATKDESKS